MRDRKTDQQMSLPFSASKNDRQNLESLRVVRPPSNVLNLNSLRADLHERAVLQRVIREGYIKTKT